MVTTMSSDKAQVINGSRRLLLNSSPDFQSHTDTYGSLPNLTESLFEEIRLSGLRGRGGAFFPFAKKLETVVKNVKSTGKSAILVANGMEGEPASFKDVTLLRQSPHLVLDGISIIAQLIKATEVYIAVHTDSLILPSLQNAIKERCQLRIDPMPIEVIALPNRYVASEESALVNGVSGNMAIPTMLRPFEKGVRKHPTLVSNVETFAHVGLIARFGSSWFQSVGLNSTPGTSLVTVGGAVKNGGVLEVPTGVSVEKLLGYCGGPTGPIQGFLTGGYGGTWVGPDFANANWEVNSADHQGVAVGAGVLLVLPKSVCGVVQSAALLNWMAGESAGQCGPCRFGLSAIADDFSDLADRRFSKERYNMLCQRLGMVVKRGACHHPDGVSRMAVSALHLFSQEVRLHVQGRCSTLHSPLIFPLPKVYQHPAASPKKKVWKV